MGTTNRLPVWAVVVAVFVAVIALFVAGNAFVASQPIVGLIAVLVAVGVVGALIGSTRRSAN